MQSEGILTQTGIEDGRSERAREQQTSMAKQSLTKFTEFGRKIVGVGYNFKALMEQMKIPPLKEPRIYLKATSSYIRQGSKIKIPTWSTEGVFYEVELGVVIERPLFRATPDEVMKGIGGYCIALDMTDKARLTLAQRTGLAWGVAKSFDTACPVGELVPAQDVPDLGDLTLWLKVNDELRQHGNTSDMTWPVAELISIMSKFFTLEYGDMILTGTPAGMGTAKKGDVIEAGIRGVDSIKFEVDVD